MGLDIDRVAYEPTGPWHRDREDACQLKRVDAEIRKLVILANALVSRTGSVRQPRTAHDGLAPAER